MLHGVWTWVGDPVRAGIVRLLARRLKPGGVVYIGYNAQPGFGHDAALQRLLRLGAAMQPHGDSVERIGGAIGFVRALKEAGAKGLAETVYLEALLKESELSVRYVAHEMLPEHLAPGLLRRPCRSAVPRPPGLRGQHLAGRERPGHDALAGAARDPRRGAGGRGAGDD